MTTTTYHRREAAGLCPYCAQPATNRVYCEVCREDFRLYHLLQPPAPDTIHGPALAHCGSWWPITPGQVTCGACGQAYSVREDQP